MPQTAVDLRRTRIALGVSTRALASRLGVTAPTVLRREAAGGVVGFELACRWRVALAFAALARARHECISDEPTYALAVSLLLG